MFIEKEVNKIIDFLLFFYLRSQVQLNDNKFRKLFTSKYIKTLLCARKEKLL